MDAQKLFNVVTDGALVRRSVNGISHSLWMQANEFVMVKQGASNPRHQLCVGETSPERLAAHWEGFCSSAVADRVIR